MLESADFYERANRGEGVRHPAGRHRLASTPSPSPPAGSSRRRPAHPGPDEPRQEEQGRVHPGRGYAPGRQAGSRCRSSPTDGARTARSCSRARTSSWPPAAASRACPASSPTASGSSPATTSCAARRCRRVLIVVGAGAVGVEFASFYKDVGVRGRRCSSTCRRWCRWRTPTSRRELERSFTRRGMKVITRARFDPASVVADDSGVCLMVGKGRARNRRSCVPTRCSSQPAAPPTPTTSAWRRRAPGSSAGSCRWTHACAPPSRTCMPSATSSAGSCSPTSRPTRAFVPSATIAGVETEPIDYIQMPRATYSRPQVASIGRTQAECESDGIPVKVGKVPFQAIGKALIGGEYGGLRQGHRPHGDRRDARRPPDRAARHGSRSRRRARRCSSRARPGRSGEAVHPHPTLSEVLGEAALAVDRPLDQLLMARTPAAHAEGQTGRQRQQAWR